ncbi:hypothetical protein [Mesorhizobium sp.]|uniref:hypothetical protein n=1 Tax=Mesorhizobium sp. TaxID=1871066 RepID=UPI000FE94C2D|nr:hypothetical protein [Mesorhizobium sp.]RWO54258.1 MAG: hypothetical protein EOS13_06680 [Mesorhizobium sp.]
MVEPIVMPGRLGQPCWTDANLEATVRTVAAMGDESASRFLATHAPMSQVHVGDAERMLTEVAVFEHIARLSARENIVLVHGAPGTGKSHLINWVKLRYDHALEIGHLADVLPVLVRRRTGSLKDALEQLVVQLPDRFHKYLEPVRSAIDRISENEARKKLATELHLELGIRWEERGKPPLPRTIRHLAEVFHAEGFGAWLCREGGVIDRNIQQLISPSEVRDRESFPPFTADEFQIDNPQQRSTGLNTANVRRLIDEFMEEPESAEHAARLCNESLRAALRELTGLGNAALSTILRSIRQDLRKENKRLVLLIEDVSTLSVLDDEVVNAVEPQDDASLCDLTSVLGMTEQAYQRLRDNQKQRVAGSGLILSLPQDGTAVSWVDDNSEIDRFIARYLNAARLPEPQVVLIADHRRRGGDVSVSACDDCSVREACHAAFGSVAFGDTVVGLFPFRPGTAPYLLGHLDETQTGVSPTQRGLLDHVTKPVMRHIDALDQGDRYPMTLPIHRQPPTDWQTLAETYLGGWPAADQTRLRLLVEAWTRRTKAPDIASDLKALLKPFSLPEFSARAADSGPVKPVHATASRPKTGSGETDSSTLVSPRSPPAPVDAATQQRLTDLLNRLERWWSSGEKLETPRDYQEMLLSFLKGALPIDDIRSPAVPAQHLLREANRGSIRIEDSATEAVLNRVSFTFNRTQDSYDLIVALIHQAVEGNWTWDFPEAERYKRIVARWLRKHQNAMLAALDPVNLSTTVPIKLATKFLCISAIIERRAELSPDTPAALSHLTSTEATKAPTVLTEPLRKLYNDLPERRRKLQNFLVEETNLPQGASGGILVIDPQVIIEAITESRSDPAIVPLPADYLTRYWKSRYQAMDGLKAWTRLSDAIAAEREEIGELVRKINYVLVRNGFSTDGDYVGFIDFIADMAQLIELLNSSFRWPSADTEFFKRDKIVDRSTLLAQILLNAAAVADGTNDADVLLFDPEALLEVAAIVERCGLLIEKANDYAEAKLAHMSGEGDPDVLESEIVAALARVIGVAREAVE